MNTFTNKAGKTSVTITRSDWLRIGQQAGWAKTATVQAPASSFPGDYSEFYKAVRDWQVQHMGNTCTICHGHNLNTQCDACGWWGKVVPDGWSKGDGTPAPELKSQATPSNVTEILATAADLDNDSDNSKLHFVITESEELLKTGYKDPNTLVQQIVETCAGLDDDSDNSKLHFVITESQGLGFKPSQTEDETTAKTMTRTHIKLAQKMDLSVPAVERRLRAFFAELFTKQKNQTPGDVYIQQLNLHTVYQQCQDLNPSRVENLAMEAGLNVIQNRQEAQPGKPNIILEDVAPTKTAQTHGRYKSDADIALAQ